MRSHDCGLAQKGPLSARNIPRNVRVVAFVLQLPLAPTAKQTLLLKCHERPFCPSPGGTQPTPPE